MQNSDSKETLYYVDTYMGCGLRLAKNKQDLIQQLAREVGTDNVKGIRKATDADIAWVRGMGGWMPVCSESI